MPTPRPTLFEYPVLGSTLDQAAELLKTHAPPFAVTAAAQTNGRGRHGRVWHSPEGNLYFTAALPVGLPMGKLPLFTLYAALRLAHNLNRTTHSRKLWVKWPNDIWCGHKKVAGFLAELITVKPMGRTLLFAIGLNLNTQKFPTEFALRATSLKKIFRHPFDISAVSRRVAAEVFASYELFCSGKYEKDLYLLWVRYNRLAGRVIKYDKNQKVCRGRVEGIASDGALCVRTSKGIETLRSGEVTLSKYL